MNPPPDCCFGDNAVGGGADSDWLRDFSISFTKKSGSNFRFGAGFASIGGGVTIFVGDCDPGDTAGAGENRIGGGEDGAGIAGSETMGAVETCCRLAERLFESLIGLVGAKLSSSEMTILAISRGGEVWVLGEIALIDGNFDSHLWSAESVNF